MKLTLLGSGGWIPSARRETCCALLREGDRAILIDAGTGVRRLLDRADLLDGADTLEIVLTHFHLDHVVGLAYLPALAPAKRIWAPGMWLYGQSSHAVLSRLVDPPLFGVELDRLARSVEEITEAGLELGTIAVTARVQERHTHPTLALRVGEDLAYCTDTAYDEANAAFARGARLLLHEAWHATHATDDTTHSAAGQAAAVARDAGVGELVLIHVNPLLERDDALLGPARATFERTVVGEDLLER